MSDTETGLVPAPRRFAWVPPGKGLEVLDEETAINAGPGTESTARWLRATVGAATGLPLPDGDGHHNHLVLRIDPRVAGELGPEGYRIVIDGYGLFLDGADPAGLFWAAQTFRQMLGPDAFRRAPVAARDEWHVPCVTIQDAPRFGWRGALLDVARHFVPKDGVLRFLDLLAAHKLNVLHLHLTDDQGWRVEIERYPRLTEVGAWRSRTKLGHRASPLWDERPHGGYYTKDDLREIVAYAAERHITVVPEIDLPGHSQAAIAAYPELGNADVVDTAALGVRDTWGVSPNVLAPTDTTLAFYENVLTEVLDVFPSRFVHIGGDECPKDQWKASPAARARMAAEGLADEKELQSWFIRHFDRWLAARGRRLIGWDEILEGGLAEGAAVASWRGYAGGVAAARAGHDVVMCPEQQVYLDHRQAPGPDEPVPIGWVRTLEDVYRFEPVPSELTPEEAGHVLGAQANLWTEVMEDQQRLDYQAFPRLAAFAEAVWSALPPPAERDFAHFEQRMAVHYRRLDALGVAYRPPGGPLPWQRRPGLLGRPIEGTPPIV
ncbi:beta-N-acetylhexosaminidase [Streptomyces mobaraensis NBRC 13819 = DSM 40847]|uniref:beta-N-acetylhexosaminidase n=1 Tax=Streptomyces mobaraensis (strain ATCC 29032 / DSM 40847 / JCM 4168 / NBRC 13819 / NCIMB 11159 / IPCR 16-22) TaxID=1223523 RepID=M2ZYW3_STRM1|nr:beta-N-acetylhexosaminidase [Streptomyces mobaraensis]EME97953.1 putative sugar hydrolase [Streptomyces mobaraensis NBRC 13819 = DSM 40847]QTT74036.1 beta-N-acetylhexosaminidase [Streptomyces mobaraensis NBRC 13819 = DSM 40847]